MNRNGELSSSLSSIAMADGEAERPSRKKGRLAYLAMRASGIRTVDATITVSPCSHFESFESSSPTEGRLGVSGANPNAV